MALRRVLRAERLLRLMPVRYSTISQERQPRLRGRSGQLVDGSDDRELVRALRRYDGVLARLAEALGIERPPLVDRSPAGRNRRRSDIERLLAEAGFDLGDSGRSAAPRSDCS